MCACGGGGPGERGQGGVGGDRDARYHAHHTANGGLNCHGGIPSLQLLKGRRDVDIYAPSTVLVS